MACPFAPLAGARLYTGEKLCKKVTPTHNPF
jgi:hypothetical protein